MSDIEDEQQQEDNQQPSDLPTSVYEAAEEQEQEEKGSKRRGGRGRRGRTTATSTTTASGATAASRGGRQMTIADLDKNLDKQMKVIERVADDVKHLKKQFNQVQRDLAKFGKSIERMKTRKK